MKKTILHIIDDLRRGGAETILVTTVQELTEYNHVIVTLFRGYEFDEVFLEKHEYICLKVKHFTLLPAYVPVLRKLIKKHDVALVHSRLFWPTLLARLSTPSGIPLITTIHSYIAGSLEYKRRIIRWIEKISYRFHKTIMLADSQGALDEYFSFLKLKPYKAVSPFTFVDQRIFKTGSIKLPNAQRSYKIISVGRLTAQKNHRYLVDAFSLLRDVPAEVDIYGMGDKYEALKEQIATAGVPVYLKGRVNNINELIASYDLFIMPSLYEGFSLAVLEAMAVGMPIMLSDTPSFREQCGDTAVYFDLKDPSDFADKLKSLLNDPEKLITIGNAAQERALKNFTLEHHMAIIRQVYADALGQ